MKLSWWKFLSIGGSLLRGLSESVVDGKITASEILKIVNDVLDELKIDVIWDLEKKKT